jgi:hypothetical protein
MIYIRLRFPALRNAASEWGSSPRFFLINGFRWKRIGGMPADMAKDDLWAPMARVIVPAPKISSVTVDDAKLNAGQNGISRYAQKAVLPRRPRHKSIHTAAMITAP